MFNLRSIKRFNLNPMHWFSQENYSTKLIACYDQPDSLQFARQKLKNKLNLQHQQIDTISPSSQIPEEKTENEPSAVGKTLFHSHFILGLGGLALGLLVSVILLSFGPAFTQLNPLFTLLSVTLVVLLVCLLFAGAITLRPDHERVFFKARDAVAKGHWALVVHLRKSDKRRAEKILRETNPREMVSSL